jgi:SAM-dependent methyltransferase
VTPELQPRPLDPLYTDYAETYDERTVGAAGDIAFYRELAQEADGLVVELGVGTGRIAIPTVQAGAPVLGLDLSPRMLAIAQRKALEAGVGEDLGLAVADMRRFALAWPAALITIPFRAFLHNLTTDDQLSTLACCRAALEPGGRLVLNVFNPDLALIAEWMQRDPEEWSEPDLGLPGSEERREYDPSRQRIDQFVRFPTREGRGSEVVIRLRWVYRYEMEHLLARSGFEVEALYGDFERNPFGVTSTELVWVARPA